MQHLLYIHHCIFSALQFTTAHKAKPESAQKARRTTLPVATRERREGQNDRARRHTQREERHTSGAGNSDDCDVAGEEHEARMNRW
jgi:phage repressor protein C with HTH and peptisase S24 domain